jgi:hypothetical protein
METPGDSGVEGMDIVREILPVVTPSGQSEDTEITCCPGLSFEKSKGLAVPSVAVPAKSKGAFFSVCLNVPSR